MPDLGPAAHLIGYLFEAGPTTGDQSLTWGELNEWQDATGVELDEFEAGAMIELSRVYLGMLHQAREPDCPAPYRAEGATPSKAAVSRSLRDAIRRNSPSGTEKKRR